MHLKIAESQHSHPKRDGVNGIPRKVQNWWSVKQNKKTRERERKVMKKKNHF